MIALISFVWLAAVVVAAAWGHREGAASQWRSDSELVAALRGEVDRLRAVNDHTYMQGFADGEAFDRVLREPSTN